MLYENGDKVLMKRFFTALPLSYVPFDPVGFEPTTRKLSKCSSICIRQNNFHLSLNIDQFISGKC